jgi:peptidoglycan biosynthesis protein MviN/MurJ (putative lipid II flippase)
LAAALAPEVNGAASAAALLIWQKPDLPALVWTLAFGTTLQLCVVLFGLLKLRLRLSFSLRPARKEVCATILIAVPVLPAMMLSNAAAGIIQVHAAQFGEGAVSIYGYAARLHVAVTQILVIGLGTVLLPHLANLWARKEKEVIVLLFRRLARMGLLITAYLTIGIVLMGDTAVGTLLGRGKLEAEQVRQVGLVWSVLSLSLFPFTFGTYLAKLAQAMRRGSAIFISSAIGFTATWGTAAVGAHCDSLPIVVGAVVTSPIAVTCYWIWWMSRYMSIRPILKDICLAALRITAIFPPAAGADLILRRLFEHYSPIIEASVRGGAYTAIVVIMLVITRTWRWFITSPARTA